MLTSFDTTSPIDFLKEIPLRRSSVFPTPGTQGYLPVVIGQWQDLGVEGTLINSEENLYLFGDLPWGSLDRVEVLSNTPNASIEETYLPDDSSFQFFPSVKDATGRLVCTAQASSSLGNRKVLGFGSGILWNNKVLEEPCDILEWLVDFMGFDSNYLDTVKISETRYAQSVKDIKLRYVINNNSSFKSIMEAVCAASYCSLVTHRSKTWLQEIVR